MDPLCAAVETEPVASCNGDSTTGIEAASARTTTTMSTSTASDNDVASSSLDKANKRRLSATGQEEDDDVETISAKRRAPSDDVQDASAISEPFNHLSDEVVLGILEYLDSSSLEKFGRYSLRVIRRGHVI